MSPSTELPYAAEAEISLSPEELNVLRAQYYKEIESGHVTTQSKFNYGRLLLEKLEVAERNLGLVRLRRPG